MTHLSDAEVAEAPELTVEGGLVLCDLIPERRVPPREGTFQRVLDGGSRTVRVASVDILPSGDDAVVLRALLDLHVRTPLPRGRVVCTGDELRAATSFLVPDLQLTDEQVYFTLKRLLAAMVTVTQHGPGGGTVMFNFISDLEIDAHETADRFVLSRVTVSLPERTLRLGRAGAAPQG